MSEEVVKWLREQIEARLELAREAAREDDASWRFDYQGRPVARIVGAPWESSCGDGTWNCDDPEDGCDELRRAGTLTGEHIALNDPQDVIARCEAELAILAAYDEACKVAEFPDEAGGFANGLEEAVKLLASGYKHREGYAEHWG